MSLERGGNDPSTVRRAATIAIALVAVGCDFGEVDYGGKTCNQAADCPSPWTCDPGLLRCVTSGDDPSGCTPAAVPSDFRVEWTTPNAIRWEWEPPPDLSAFVRYEIRTGIVDDGDFDPDHPDTVWTSEQNIELGRPTLPHGRIEDLVRGSVTWGLEPNTLYGGQLRVYDKAGCAWRSATVTAATAEPPTPGIREIVLFEGAAQVEGAVFDPAGLYGPLASPGVGYMGDDECLAFDSPGDTYNNLHVQNLDVDLSVIGEDLVTTAYWELALLVPRTSGWGELYFTLGSHPPRETPPHTIRYRPYPFTGSSEYRLLQIPLHAMFYDVTGTAPVEADFGEHVTIFTVGGEFLAADQIRIDHVSIRW